MLKSKKQIFFIFLIVPFLSAISQQRRSAGQATTELIYLLSHMGPRLDLNYLIQLPALLSDGANPNVRDQYGNTTLLILSRLDATNLLAKILLQHDTNPNLSDLAGNSPLLWATKNNNKELVNLLIVKKANPNLTNADGISPLMIATDNGNLEIVQMLLNNGADPHMKDNKGASAFDIARKKNFGPIIKLLSEKIKLP
ncbi:hypothetical protein BH09DEP1_BH09DEP1_7850 [soil metagenome]